MKYREFWISKEHLTDSCPEYNCCVAPSAGYFYGVKPEEEVCVIEKAAYDELQGEYKVLQALSVRQNAEIKELKRQVESAMEVGLKQSLEIAELQKQAEALAGALEIYAKNKEPVFDLGKTARQAIADWQKFKDRGEK